MLITVDPVVLNFGPLAVGWFGLLAVVGLGLATWRSLRELERQGFSRALALDALAWGLPGGLLTARLVHVLGWWDYYLTHAQALWQLNVDGLSLWGGLLGGGTIIFARLRSKQAPLRRRKMLDVVAPNVALGIAVGQLGAFLDGHGQGVASDLPWATQYASRLAATPDFGVPRQPAQLYDALLALGLFIALSNLPRGWPAGSRLAGLLVLYGSARLVLGAVQLDPAFLFGLQIDQLLALAAVGFGAWYGLRPMRSGLRKAMPLEATLFMKPDCHLCEAAVRELERLRGRHPHMLELVDISTNADLLQRYGERVPVLRVGGREYDAPLMPGLLERALREPLQAEPDHADSVQADSAQPDSAPTPTQPTPTQSNPSQSTLARATPVLKNAE